MWKMSYVTNKFNEPASGVEHSLKLWIRLSFTNNKAFTFPKDTFNSFFPSYSTLSVFPNLEY